MNIDFPPPSKGTYNNAGSSRQLVNYMEHEDMERIAKGLFTDGFFNLTGNDIYKAEVIKDIDTNIGQLMKTDAKFYAIHVSPSAKELALMGKTEQEQSDAMKRFIREIFIPAYAANFNKGLNAAAIKFYGKIHFERERSENASFLHCHLIVSRKDQSNSKKLSPLTNHRSTKKGAITGGFDRTNLFKTVEAGFDKLFNYDRQTKESFEYCNAMKNGSMEDRLHMQERELKEQTLSMCEKKNDMQTNVQQHSDASTQSGIASLFSILSPETNGFDATLQDELQQLKNRKKRKRRLIR